VAPALDVGEGAAPLGAQSEDRAADLVDLGPAPLQPADPKRDRVDAGVARGGLQIIEDLDDGAVGPPAPPEAPGGAVLLLQESRQADLENGPGAASSPQQEGPKQARGEPEDDRPKDGQDPANR